MATPTLRVTVLTTVCLASLSGQRLLLDLRGASSDAFGAAVAGAGDVDLDGLPDLLVGAPDANATAGRVDLWSGRGRLVYALTGAAAGDRLGSGVARLGDVDRDGHPDFVVTGAAVAAVVSGASGSVRWLVPALQACAAGDADGDGHADFAVTRAGGANGREIAIVSGGTGVDLARFHVPAQENVVAMAGAGDADGDGRGDVVVGMSLGTAGRAWVLSAAHPTPVWEWSTQAASGYVLGQAVAPAGDRDGDGHADVAVAVHETSLVAPIYRNGGEVTVYSGRTGSVLQRISGVFWTDRYVSQQIYYKRYGQALAGGGDLDGDGRLDLLAHEASSFAPARVRSSTGLRVAPAGSAFAFAGDLDRDGFDDVVVGDAATGSVQVVAGPGRSVVAEVVSAAAPPSGRQLAVRGIGDQDGDGVRDVLLARTDGDQTLGVKGSFTVFSGRDGAVLASLAGPSTFPWNATVAGVGDLDRDGREDRAVGWHGFVGGWVDVQRSQAGTLRLPATHASFGVALAGGGSVEVRSGLDATTLSAFTGPSGSFGRGLCMAGDVDGDGVGELLVAAPGAGVVQMRGAPGTRVLWTIASAAQVLRPLPDQDGDGRPDIALLEPATGSIEVRSGASGSLVRTLAEAGLAAFDGGADVDGDGAADFVFGLPAANVARIVSGASGVTLLRHVGYPDGLGGGVAWTGPVDGFLQAAAAAEYGGTWFTGYLRLFRDDGVRARAARFGHGCRTTFPAPDLTVSTWPVLGATVQLTVEHLVGGMPAAILAGASDTAWSGLPLPMLLTPIGVPACALWTSIDATLPFSPPDARQSVPWVLPDDDSLLGARVFVQTVQLDVTGAPTLRASAGLRLRLGR